MKSLNLLGGLMVGLVGLTVVTESQASPPSAERSSKADRPPRKVVVGAVSLPMYGPYPGLAERLKMLGGQIDEMASQAAAKYSKGLDLAILTEDSVTSTQGPALQRALPIDGPWRETFSALARKHKTYIIAPLELIEEGPNGTFASNAAVLFDRKGEVAGIYRKLHPVANLGRDTLEGGVTPGKEVPVFDCDFGRLGIQICYDISFDDGWAILAKKGAEIVAWPSQSPATALPAARAGANRFYIVSSTWRDNATVYEPDGLIGAQVLGSNKVLVHQLDLSYAVLPWSGPLRDGLGLKEKFGDKVGYHYEHSEDVGLFWSNDPQMSIGAMFRTLGLEEEDTDLARNRKLHDAARGGPVSSQ
jgi:predicted amidohydrolase